MFHDPIGAFRRKADYSHVSAVVDYYGIVDFEKVEISNGTHEVPPFTFQDWIGLNYTNEMARKTSARHYVGEHTPPFLIFHGDRDECVPIEQSELMYKTLQEHHVYAEYYVLNQEGHGAPAFYQDSMKEVVLVFLEKVLKQAKEEV